MHYCNAKDRYSIRFHTILLSAVNYYDIGVLDITGIVMHLVNLNLMGCFFMYNK
jgi:hypothetical protein